MEPIVEVKTGDALTFLGTACRNWQRMPSLSSDDIADVAGALQSFVKARLASPPADLKADNAALVEALRALEQANEDLCATRSQVTYNSMIHHDKAYDQLQALDDARRNARAILQRFPTTESSGTPSA